MGWMMLSQSWNFNKIKINKSSFLWKMPNQIRNAWSDLNLLSLQLNTRVHSLSDCIPHRAVWTLSDWHSTFTLLSLLQIWFLFLCLLHFDRLPYFSVSQLYFSHPSVSACDILPLAITKYILLHQIHFIICIHFMQNIWCLPFSKLNVLCTYVWGIA